MTAADSCSGAGIVHPNHGPDLARETGVPVGSISKLDLREAQE